MSETARLLPLFAFVVFAVGGPAANALDGTPAWTYSTVHTATYAQEIPTAALAFDHYGRPTLCWGLNPLITPNTNYVMYSQLSGLGLWAHEVVEQAGTPILRTGLVFDRAERPITAWVKESGAVSCAFNHGSPQCISTPAAAPEPPILSLDYDIAGNLRGMYCDPSTHPGNLQKIGLTAIHDFTTDALTTLSLDFDTLNDAVLATDHQGLRYVAARLSLDGGQDAIALSWEPSFPTDPPTAWPSTLYKTADAILGLDMATNPITGRPAFAYTTYDDATDTSTLWLATSDGAGLVEEAVLSSTGASIYEDVSLAFDRSDGRPGLAFEERAGSNERLIFAYLNEASAWQTSVVDDSISIEIPLATHRGPSLAYDDYGTSWPAIAYIDSDGSLRVAFDPPVPEPGTAFLVLIGVGLWGRRRRH